jgi:hypothetical protein
MLDQDKIADVIPFMEKSDYIFNGYIGYRSDRVFELDGAVE